MKFLQMARILLSLSGVFTHSGEWGVKYPDIPICAVKGSNISIPCTYSYPTLNTNIQVTQMLWCSMTSNEDQCHNPPYVYNSSLNTKSDFVYTGDDKSDCTLLIHNVQFSYSGLYKFRFITNKDKYTGDPGVTLQVTDLKVSLIQLSGNGTLKHGDSLNLTCDVNCTQSSSQFVWSKNNIQLQTSGPVLHFPALTLRDSGNYTCTWKTDTTSGSKSVLVQVEGNDPGPADGWLMWTTLCVIVGVIVFVAVISGTVIIIRRKVHAEDISDLNTNVQQGKDVSDPYANVQQKSDSDRHVIVPQTKDVLSHIYANVQMEDIYANV